MKKNKEYSEIFEDVLKEFSGGSVYNPTSVSTNPLSYGNIRKGNNPPYSIYTDIEGHNNVGTGVVTQSKDETDAPGIAPYPLQIVTDFLVNAYENLSNVKDQIKSSYDNPALTPTQQNELEHIEKKTKNILGLVKSLGDQILKIKLHN